MHQKGDMYSPGIRYGDMGLIYFAVDLLILHLIQRIRSLLQEARKECAKRVPSRHDALDDEIFRSFIPKENELLLTKDKNITLPLQKIK